MIISIFFFHTGGLDVDVGTGHQELLEHRNLASLGGDMGGSPAVCTVCGHF